MQQVDKSGHVVGFIIGSTVTRSSKLPDNVFQEIAKCLQDKREFPPLIVLKAADYAQFQKHATSHMSSVKEIKCLSNKGSKFVHVSMTSCLSCCHDSECKVEMSVKPL